MSKTPITIPSGMLAMFNQKKGPADGQNNESKASTQGETPATRPASGEPEAAAGAIEESRLVGIGESGSVSATPAANLPATASAAIVPTPAPDRTEGGDRGAFRKRLDDLDSLMAGHLGQVELALARGIVKQTMIEMRTFPEYAGIVEDGDVRNIFIFLRRAVETAKVEGATVKEKKTRKAVKESAIDFSKMPSGIDMLGSMDTDSINAIMGVKK